MKSFKGDVVDKIPLFNEDGEAKFLLRVKNKGSYEGVPKYQAWSPHKYADLVAITTAGEAEGAANISEAGELGTRLIKWNSTGKGASFYASIGDMRCAAVDGQIASLEETGTTINGKHYPYWRTLLPGPYNTCHPNCRHRFAPILEEVVGDEVRTELADQAKALGVANVRYDILPEHKGIAEDVNGALSMLKERNLPVPKNLDISNSHFVKYAKARKSVSGEYDESTDTLYVNPNSNELAHPEEFIKSKKSRYFSSYSKNATFFHEYGHLFHYKFTRAADYVALNNTPMTKKNIYEIRGAISGYATKNWYETFAEIVSGLLTGDLSYSQIPESALALFGKYLEKFK